MDRLHRDLSHGDSFWLWYMSVGELLKVDLELCQLLGSFGSQAGVVAGCGSGGNTPAKFWYWGRKLTAKAWTSCLTDPCSSSPKKDTFVDHHQPNTTCPLGILLQDILSPTVLINGKPVRGSKRITSSTSSTSRPPTHKMAVSAEKITLYNLADLKNTSDDALPNYLNSLGLKQSHTLTDVRLALGYSAFLVAAACFLWDYKLGFESTKYYTAGAVAVYSLLNTALTLWIWLKEKGIVYVGTAPKGETVCISSSPLMTTEREGSRATTNMADTPRNRSRSRRTQRRTSPSTT